MTSCCLSPQQIRSSGKGLFALVTSSSVVLFDFPHSSASKSPSFSCSWMLDWAQQVRVHEHGDVGEGECVQMQDVITSVVYKLTGTVFFLRPH